MHAEEENKAVKVLQLLTHKPLTYAANVGEGDLMDDGKSNSQVQALMQKAREENCEVVVVSAQVRYRQYKKAPSVEPKRKGSYQIQKTAFGVFRSRYLAIFSRTLYQLSYKGLWSRQIFLNTETGYRTSINAFCFHALSKFRTHS